MPTTYQFIGVAPSVAEVRRGTPLLIMAGTILRVAIQEAPEHYIEYTCATADVPTCVSGLVDAWNASTDPLFQKAVASIDPDSTSSLLLTAARDGVPIDTLVTIASGVVNLTGRRNQLVTIQLPSATGGSFVLRYQTGVTDQLDYDASAGDIADGLMELVGDGNVQVVDYGNGLFTIEFIADMGNQYLEPLQAISRLITSGEVAVTSIQTGSAGASAVHTVTLPAQAIEGTWRIGVGAYQTTDLAWNATGAQVQAALQALPNVATSGALVTGDGPYAISWGGLLALQPVTPFVTSFLLGTAEITPSEYRQGISGTDAVQSFTIPTTVTAGTFTVTFRSETTPSQNYDVSAADLQTALEALTTIDLNNVTVAAAAGQYTLYFQADLGSQDIDLVTVNSGILMDASDPIPVETTTLQEGYQTNEQQLMTVSSAVIGSYTLTFNGYTTPALFWPDPDSGVTIQTRLQNLASIGASNVTVSSAYTSGTNGTFTITFGNSRAGKFQPTIGVNPSLGKSSSVSLVSRVPGTPASYECNVTGATTGVYSVQKATAGPGTEYGDIYTVAYNGTAADVQAAFNGVYDADANGRFTWTATGGPLNSGTPVIATCNQNGSPIDPFDLATAGLLVVVDDTIDGGGYVTSLTPGTPATVNYANETQTLTFSTLPNSGAFQLSFDGYTTANQNFNVAAADLQTALEGLTSIGAGNVTVSGGGYSTGTFILDFSGTMDATPQPLFGVPVNTLYRTAGGTITITEVTEGSQANEIQIVKCAGVPEDGTYNIEFNGETTTDLNWYDAPATIQSALEDLSTVTSGCLRVTGGNVVQGTRVEFRGAMGNANQNAMVGNSALIGLLTIATVEDVKGVSGRDCQQLVVRPTTVTGGSYRLTITAGGVTETTNPIRWDATAWEVQEAIERLSKFAEGDVVVTSPTYRSWMVTFAGQYSGVGIAEMDVVNNLTGANLCSVAHATAGKYGSDAVQTIWIVNATGGYWRASSPVTGEGTVPIPFNATEAQVRAAFAAAPTSKSVAVVRNTTTYSTATGYTLTFTGADARQWQPLLTGESYNQTGYTPLSNKVGGVVGRVLKGGPAEDKVLTVDVTAAGGTYYLQFNGVSSSGIAWNSNAAQALPLLEAIPSLAGNIATGSYTNCDYSVTFTGTLAGSDQPDLQPVTGELVAPYVSVSMEVTQRGYSGVNSVHMLSFNPTGAFTPYGAESSLMYFWKLASNGWPDPDYAIVFSEPIAWGDTAEEVYRKCGNDARLNIIGGPVGSAPISVEFVGEFIGIHMPTVLYGVLGPKQCWYHAPQPTGQGTMGLGVDAGSVPAYAAQLEQQTLTPSTAPTGGTYTITNFYLSWSGTESIRVYCTTSALNWNANSAQVQAALAALPSIGGGNVSVLGGFASGETIIVQFGANVNAYTGAPMPSTTVIPIYNPFGEIVQYYSAELNVIPGFTLPELTVNSYMTAGSLAPSVTVIERTKGHEEQYEVQQLTLIGTGTGKFKIVPEGVLANMTAGDSGGIDSPYTAADLQAQLRFYYDLHGDTGVTATGADGGPWTITWSTTAAHNLLGFNAYTYAAPAPYIWSEEDVTGVDGIDPVQDVTIRTTAVSGSFRLAVSGETTGAIPYASSADTVAAFLCALPVVGPSGAEVSYVPGPYYNGVYLNGYYRITFTGALGGQPLDLITADGTGLTANSYAPTVTVQQTGLSAGNEQQWLTPDAGITSGTWTLSHGGFLTAALEFDATNAQIQDALDASHGADVIRVLSGGPIATTPVLIELAGPYARSDEPLVTITSYLYGTLASSTITVTTDTPGAYPADDWQRITAPTGIVGGEFRLKHGDEYTAYIPWNASYAQIQTAVCGLSTVGTGNFVATGGPLDVASITGKFQGTLSHQAVTLLEAVGDVGVRQSTEIGITVVYGSAGTSIAWTTVTENSGPNCWSIATNWDPPEVPVDGSNLLFANCSVDLTWGLPQHNQRFGTIEIWQTHTGAIGRTDVVMEPSGYSIATGGTTLRISANSWVIGKGGTDGGGSSLLRIDIGDSPLMRVENTGYPSGDLRALMLSGGSNTILTIDGGSVGLAGFPGETASISTVTTSPTVQLYLGEGAVIGDIVFNGGEIECYASYTSLTVLSGRVYQRAGTPGDVTLAANTRFYYLTPEDGGNFVVDVKAKFDFSQGTEEVAIASLTGGGTKIDPLGRCTVLG